MEGADDDNVQPNAISAPIEEIYAIIRGNDEFKTTKRQDIIRKAFEEKLTIDEMRQDSFVGQNEVEEMEELLNENNANYDPYDTMKWDLEFIPGQKIVWKIRDHFGNVTSTGETREVTNANNFYEDELPYKMHYWYDGGMQFKMMKTYIVEDGGEDTMASFADLCV